MAAIDREPAKLIENMGWVIANWQAALDLCESPEFCFALETFDNAQFIPNHAMMMVSLWGALEAIFARAKAELRYSVSSNIATFLTPRGPERLQKQKEVQRLYDGRSAAAHGPAKQSPDDLLQTFQLLRAAIVRMIEDKAVPTKNDLEEMLFVK
ncbi:HEPN domain-containing protein [Lysobacter sp. Root604]|uniref:HEPN domain-containing protein n=1 Tax=Lysobacter sp. Root604 TaxID=1736568 RepID=UPI0012F998AD|nr:HEPN domain-containing protein [Lysobacter sp. Root604]